MQGNRHHWTFDEDRFCCQKFIEYYVENKSDMDISLFIHLLQRDLPDIQRNSLRMKIQNIKQISSQLGLEDTSALKPLSNYSAQNMQAMIMVLRERGIRL